MKMDNHIKNNFCEIIAAASEMWHERKGFDTTENKRSMKAHLTAMKKELERIKKNIGLIESQELPMLEQFINHNQ